MIFNMSTGGASTADKVKYNNTESGLKSTDVQGAIDEVNSSLDETKSNLEKLQKMILVYEDFYVCGDASANVVLNDDHSKKISSDDYIHLSILEKPSGKSIYIQQYNNYYAVLNADTFSYDLSVGTFKVRGIKISK